MRLTPYGSADQVHSLSKVGKKRTPLGLAARMPSADVAAKVGKVDLLIDGGARRVVRRQAR